LPDPGSFRLGADDEANYSTCKRCMLVYYADEQEVVYRFFFVSGTLDIDATSDPFHGFMHASVSDAVFVEVSIDEQTYVSTPLPAGLRSGAAAGGIGVWGEPCEGWGGVASGEGGGGSGEGGAPAIPDPSTEISASESWSECFAGAPPSPLPAVA